MIRNAPDMKVRLSADLRQKVETAARDNNRTMNAEIFARLEQSFREGRAVNPLQSPDLETRLDRLERFMVDVTLDNRIDRMEARLSRLEKRFK
jgi:hypothetical protein